MSVSLDRLLTAGLEVATGINLEPPTLDVNLPDLSSVTNELVKKVDFISDVDTSLDSFNNNILNTTPVDDIRARLNTVKNNISTLKNKTLTNSTCEKDSNKSKLAKNKELSGANDRNLFGDKIKDNLDGCNNNSLVEAMNIQQDVLSKISDKTLMEIDATLNTTIGDITLSGCLVLDKAIEVNKALNSYANAINGINGNLNLKNTAKDGNNCNGNSTCKPSINFNLNTDMIPVPDFVGEGMAMLGSAINTVNDKLNQVAAYEDKIIGMTNDAINNAAGKIIKAIGPNGVAAVTTFMDTMNTVNKVSNFIENNPIKSMVLSSVSDTIFCMGNNAVGGFVDNILSTGLATPSELVGSLSSSIGSNIDKNAFNKFKVITSITDSITDPFEKTKAKAHVKHNLPNIMDNINKNNMTTTSPASMYDELTKGLSIIDEDWDKDANGNPDYSLLNNNKVFMSIIDSKLNSKTNTDGDRNKLLKQKIVTKSKPKLKTKTNNTSNAVRNILELPIIYNRGSDINYDGNITTTPNYNINNNVNIPTAKPTKSNTANTIGSTIGDLARGYF